MLMSKQDANARIAEHTKQEIKKVGSVDSKNANTHYAKNIIVELLAVLVQEAKENNDKCKGNKESNVSNNDSDNSRE